MKVSGSKLFLLIFLATLTGYWLGEKSSVGKKLTLASSRSSHCMEEGSPEGLMGQPEMQDLMTDLPEFEFFFADAPDHDSICDQCWYADPGGKGEPNEDRRTGQTYHWSI